MQPLTLVIKFTSLDRHSAAAFIVPLTVLESRSSILTSRLTRILADAKYAVTELSLKQRR